MQRDLVERRRWLSEKEFLDGVALGQTMPGPLAARVVMWIGYLRRGWAGALATATAFIAPSFLFVLGVHTGRTPARNRPRGSHLPSALLPGAQTT